MIERSERDGLVRVLVVSSQHLEHVALQRMFAQSAWSFSKAGTIDEAGSMLHEQNVSVILCDEHLPDGGWRDLLSTIQGFEEEYRLIVMARHADDRLWSDVLQFGAYDVLSKPLIPAEVFRVIGLAWRQSARKNSVRSERVSAAPLYAARTGS